MSGVRAVSAQVAPSDYMLGELRKHAHCDEVLKISLGLDVSAYPLHVEPRGARSPIEAEMVVGVAGRLIRGKGIDVVLRAIAGREMPVMRVKIAGDGPDRASLEALASRLGLGNRVHFLGWVHDMAAFWRSCDVAVVPSNEWIESFGMVAAEAMACGRPVIGSNRGGLAELVVHGETGILFEPGNWQELSVALTQYACDPSLRQRMGDSARRRCVELYDIDRCAADWDSLLVRLLHSRSDGISPAQTEH